MQQIEHLLCGIAVLQLPEMLYQPGNGLNQTFPALKFHINKFKPTGTNRLHVTVNYTRFSYRLRTRVVSCFNNKYMYLPVGYENYFRFRHCCSVWLI